MRALIICIAATTAIAVPTIKSQPIVSLNFGLDGVGMNVGAPVMPVLYTIPARPQVYLPHRAGYVPVQERELRRADRHMRKADREYRKAMKHYSRASDPSYAIAAFLFGRDDDFDEYDYDDFDDYDDDYYYTPPRHHKPAKKILQTPPNAQRTTYEKIQGAFQGNASA